MSDHRDPLGELQNTLPKARPARWAIWLVASAAAFAVGSAALLVLTLV